MGYNSVPPRWDEYTKIGKLIPGTRIIPFKVPLRKEICSNLSDQKLRFTVDDLINEVNNLTLVIDLTMTTRFYNKEDLERRNVKYVKFFVKGGGNMPRELEVTQFCNTIIEHLKDNSDGIVGVHCTHGLNRTGYFVCRYMIDCLNFSGSSSVELFENCRGHSFDRENYRNFLIQRNPSNETKKLLMDDNQSLERLTSYERNEDYVVSSKKCRLTEEKHVDTTTFPKKDNRKFVVNTKGMSSSDPKNYNFESYKSDIRGNDFEQTFRNTDIQLMNNSHRNLKCEKDSKYNKKYFQDYMKNSSNDYDFHKYQKDKYSRKFIESRSNLFPGIHGKEREVDYFSSRTKQSFDESIEYQKRNLFYDRDFK